MLLNGKISLYLLIDHCAVAKTYINLVLLLRYCNRACCHIKYLRAYLLAWLSAVTQDLGFLSSYTREHRMSHFPPFQSSPWSFSTSFPVVSWGSIVIFLYLNMISLWHCTRLISTLNVITPPCHAKGLTQGFREGKITGGPITLCLYYGWLFKWLCFRETLLLLGPT